MLRSSLFFLTIFSSSLTVITCFSGQSQTQAQVSAAKDNVQQAEQIIKTPDKKKVTSPHSPYTDITQAQINQIKRYDCRLRHRLISHNYEKEAKKIAAASSATTIKKDTSTSKNTSKSKLQEKQ